MSDPVTNVEIEDVLSSIRRLVSEETRPPRPRSQPAQSGSDRLVLTPSLRVHDPEPRQPAPEPAKAARPASPMLLTNPAPAVDATEARGPERTVDAGPTETRPQDASHEPAEAAGTPPEAPMLLSNTMSDEDAVRDQEDDKAESETEDRNGSLARLVGEEVARAFASDLAEQHAKTPAEPAEEAAEASAAEERQAPLTLRDVFAATRADLEGDDQKAGAPASSAAYSPMDAEADPQDAAFMTAWGDADRPDAPEAGQGGLLDGAEAAPDPQDTDDAPENGEALAHDGVPVWTDFEAHRSGDDAGDASDRSPDTAGEALEHAPDAEDTADLAPETTDFTEAQSFWAAPLDAVDEPLADAPRDQTAEEPTAFAPAELDDTAWSDPQDADEAQQAPDASPLGPFDRAPVATDRSASHDRVVALGAAPALDGLDGAEDDEAHDAPSETDEAAMIASLLFEEEDASPEDEALRPDEEAASAALQLKIAALEKLVASQKQDWDAETLEAAQERPTFVRRNREPVLDWEDHLPGPVTKADQPDEEAAAEASAEARDDSFEDDAAAHDAEAPARGGEPALAGASGDLAESARTGGELAEIDEEVLRQMVSDIVRQELQGVLGERITRNVRKLVRREIHRVVMSQEFD